MVLLKRILVLVAVFLTMFFSCSKENALIEGEGTLTTKTISVSDFSGVNLIFASNVTIKQGTKQEVKATGHPNIIDRMRTSVSEGIWGIWLEDGNYGNYELSVEITVPNIKQLELSGAGNLIVNNFENQIDLSVVHSGNGNMTLNEFEGVTNFDINITGSGEFMANNDIKTLETLNLNASGNGKYLGFKINSPDCNIVSSGSGKIEIAASEILNVILKGSGNIYYKGSPSITQNISGSGDLINIR